MRSGLDTSRLGAVQEDAIIASYVNDELTEYYKTMVHSLTPFAAQSQDANSAYTDILKAYESMVMYKPKVEIPVSMEEVAENVGKIENLLHSMGKIKFKDNK
jgi:hypothetical protein